MADATFPRSARLLRGAEFQTVFAARQRVSGRFFLINWSPSTTEAARLGLAVSRKVDRRAVVRNRLKRVLRDYFRNHRDALPALDLVVLPRREACTATTEALQADLRHLWRRLASLPRQQAQGTMPAALPTSPSGTVVTAPVNPLSPSVPQR